VPELRVLPVQLVQLELPDRLGLLVQLVPPEPLVNVVVFHIYFQQLLLTLIQQVAILDSIML
jgi:hypothetical protein